MYTSCVYTNIYCWIGLYDIFHDKFHCIQTKHHILWFHCFYLVGACYNWFCWEIDLVYNINWITTTKNSCHTRRTLFKQWLVQTLEIPPKTYIYTHIALHTVANFYKKSRSRMTSSNLLWRKSYRSRISTSKIITFHSSCGGPGHLPSPAPGLHPLQGIIQVSPELLWRMMH